MKNTQPYIQAEAKQELIFEQEQVFPHYLADFLEDSFLREPLCFGHTALGPSKTHDDQFFGRVYYWNKFAETYHPGNLPYGVEFLRWYVCTEGIKMISPDAKFLKLHRLAFNGQTPTNKPMIHIDEAEFDTSWTFLYYINESDGDTMIYNNFKDQKPFYACKYQKNKIVAFPALYAHQALPPAEYPWRMSFAVTLHIDTSLNPLILEGRRRISRFVE